MGKPCFWQGLLTCLLLFQLDTGEAVKRRGRALLENAIQQRPFAVPDYSYYHSSDKLLAEVKELIGRHPDGLQLESLELELSSYQTVLHVVTVNVQPQRSEEEKLRVLLDFGQHGREPITSEVGLRLLNVLAGDVSLPGVDRAALEETLAEMIVKVIPMENVNGRKKVEGGELCERKNGRGVDTNRNWSVDWGKKEADYEPTEEFPGTGPFSEPEAALLRDLTASFKPHVWVNVHSGMEALFMPYDHKHGSPVLEAASAMTRLLQLINESHCQKRCVVGSGGGAVGYLAHGTATDYMYDTAHVPLAFTWEIYGDESAHHDDCFRMFNPVTKEAFEAVVGNWTGAFITLLFNVPSTLKNATRAKVQLIDNGHKPETVALLGPSNASAQMDTRDRLADLKVVDAKQQMSMPLFHGNRHVGPKDALMVLSEQSSPLPTWKEGKSTLRRPLIVLLPLIVLTCGSVIMLRRRFSGWSLLRGRGVRTGAWKRGLPLR